jgi:ADP-heptose:LPS heptosyltransferase
MKKVTMRQWQAPGDLLVMTVALRDLHLSYPETYQTQVLSCYPEVFYNNPYNTPFKFEDPWIDIWYKKWWESYRETGYHFTDAFIASFDDALGTRIQKTSIWPEIYLTDDEKDLSWLSTWGIEKPYWVLNAGIKMDWPLKQYPPFYWQKVINYLNEAKSKFGFPIIQAGHSNDIHPQFDGVKSLVGKTNNLRSYFALMYHAEGSMGHVSLQMHVSAAFRKPCVVVAGGREGMRWEAYPGHQYLNVTGCLPCAGHFGCWHGFPSECEDLRRGIPQCYRMITPEDVAAAALKYYCR